MVNRLMSMTGAVVVLFAFSPAIFAQTVKQPIARTPDGKPSFSGHWVGGGDAMPSPGANGGGAAAARRTRAQLAKEILPLTPWGWEQVQYATKGDGEFAGEIGDASDPRFHQPCDSASSPTALGGPVEIVQNSYRLLLVYLGNINGVTSMWARQIWISREHPKDPTDYVPTWMGHSVGKWDGDTLVADTIGIREGTLIDSRTAAPQSGQLHLVERYHLIDGETLRVDRTFEDPKAYTKPWGNSKVFKLQTNWQEMAEDWETAEQHTVCIGGAYPPENDPWFGEKGSEPGNAK
jgi:hypothetical protein